MFIRKLLDPHFTHLGHVDGIKCTNDRATCIMLVMFICVFDFCCSAHIIVLDPTELATTSTNVSAYPAIPAQIATSKSALKNVEQVFATPKQIFANVRKAIMVLHVNKNPMANWKNPTYFS